MIAINRDLALEQTPAYTACLRRCGGRRPDPDTLRVGKDRTGFAAALIQAALGVPEAALLHDYLLTDRYLPIELEIAKLQEKYQWSGPADALLPILQVHGIYLRRARCHCRKLRLDRCIFARSARRRCRDACRAARPLARISRLE